VIQHAQSSACADVPPIEDVADIGLSEQHIAVANIMGYACSHNLMDILFPQGASVELPDVVDRLCRWNETSWSNTGAKRCIRAVAGVLDLVVKASCWREVLEKTAYPHQFAVAFLYALPARSEASQGCAPSSWDVFLEWTPDAYAFQSSRHLTMLTLTDALFGSQWRPVLGMTCENWNDLYSAILTHRPLFIPGILHGGSPTKGLHLPPLDQT
jgi:hypothetical protein